MVLYAQNEQLVKIEKYYDNLQTHTKKSPRLVPNKQVFSARKTFYFLLFKNASAVANRTVPLSSGKRDRK